LAPTGRGVQLVLSLMSGESSSSVSIDRVLLINGKEARAKKGLSQTLLLEVCLANRKGVKSMVEEEWEDSEDEEDEEDAE
jgi:hypothetical protein